MRSGFPLISVVPMAWSTEYGADSGLEDSATVPVAELAQPVKAAMLAAVRAASVAKPRFL